MTLEEVREVGDFFKSECVCDLGNSPVSLLQQNLSFLVDTARNNLGGGLPGGLFQHLIEVIDMDLQRIGEVARCAQLQRLGCILNRKLTLEKFDEQAEYPRSGVGTSVSGFQGLEFLAVVDEFHHVGAE